MLIRRSLLLDYEEKVNEGAYYFSFLTNGEMNIEMIRIKHLLSNINRIRISITAKNQLRPPPNHPLKFA